MSREFTSAESIVVEVAKKPVVKKKTEDVKVLWEKRKTPEQLEEEAYHKKQASVRDFQPVEAPQPSEAVVEEPQPEPEVIKDEPEASLPATELQVESPAPPYDAESVDKALHDELQELQDIVEEAKEDVARLHRVVAGLYKRHPELFQSKKTEAAMVKVEPKKESPYMPMMAPGSPAEKAWFDNEERKEARTKAIPAAYRVLPRGRK